MLAYKNLQTKMKQNESNSKISQKKKQIKKTTNPQTD